MSIQITHCNANGIVQDVETCETFAELVKLVKAMEKTFSSGDELIIRDTEFDDDDDAEE